MAVELAFQNLSEISSDSNLSSFGQALEDTFRAGALNPDIVGQLNAVKGEAEYAAAARSLTPSLLYGSARQLYMTSLRQMPQLDQREDDHTGVYAWLDGAIDDRKAGFERPGFPGYETQPTYGSFGVDYPVLGNIRLGVSVALGEGYSGLSVRACYDPDTLSCQRLMLLEIGPFHLQLNC